MPGRVFGSASVIAAIVVSSLLSIALPASAAGPTFTVDSLLDQIDDGTQPGTCHTAANTCTLRAAIMQANRTSGVGATVVLPAGPPYVLTIPATGADTEYDGDLDLTAPVSGNPVISIVGAGAATTIIDANQLDRVLNIDAGRTATISGVTIRNGYVPGDDGGGIHNNGSLTLSNATLSGNHAQYGGGIWDGHVLTVIESTIIQNTTVVTGAGILSLGDLNVRSSTIEGNTAGGLGGGIYTGTGLTMRNSTISGNHAVNRGGGIVNSGNMTAMNSTISQNDSDEGGGGLFSNNGTVNVYNTTIVFNGADADGDSVGAGGGVFNLDDNGAVFNLRNSIVAGNVTSDSTIFGYYDDCSGTLTGYGANLFKAVLVASGCTVNGSWGLLNNLSTLGPLQDNGGPTETHALLEGSNAIDGTNPAFGCVDYNSVVLDTDQRGAPRISGARCDIGAFEVPEPGAGAAVAVAVAMLAALRSACRRS